MVRQTVLAVFALLGLASIAQAVIVVLLYDEFDDTKLVLDVSDQEAVKAFRKELDAFEQSLLRKEEPDIEKLLGKPTAKAKKTYAMPVAQPRGVALSGFRNGADKDHTEFYPVEDFAGVEVWYGANGKSPVAVLVYFKADPSFPKLTTNNVQERLAWDRDRFAKLVKLVEDRQPKK